MHGQKVEQETYLLPNHWSLHFYEYRGMIECAEHGFALQPGTCSIVPPGIPITFHYQGPSEHFYCHFSLPNDLRGSDFKPQFFNLDPRLPQLKNLLIGAIKLKRQTPMRANIRLWDVLLGLQAIASNADSHPRHTHILETASEIVSQEMARNLSIQELAQRCQISHNQLTRIIKDQTGATPAIWLRHLRTDRAKELLTYSDLPIKVIAGEVGYPDLQHFNKVMRQRFGQSPRNIRVT